MELKQALDRLAELQRKMYAYQAASSSLYLDGTTVAPKDTAEGRGVALGVLAGEQHKLFSDPQVGELLDLKPSTVQTRLARGRERLKKLLTED